MAGKFASVDEYVAALPDGTRGKLAELISTVRSGLPDAHEVISYQIPTFRLHGKSVVHVAAWKRHLSMYPAPRADGELAAELAPYQTGNGTLRFGLDAPLPHTLVRRVVAELVKQQFDARH